ncbi:Redox-sensing transcriptional repressor Rex [uncultured Desulfobacterium sp.]|uniref:Redox-sensing transcriptional repressor Rex n=1 Tax=uncultured Desulfobacterium sp. TaxID=201089 RepID=A0A445MZQ9_9BACT|nr:Redox-sensing transcriptional repressor Rex [uncultured Desulfobacterium sp.]
MKKTAKIPYAAIERLALYSRPLKVLLKTGVTVVSSEKLAEYCGVNPAQVRKDLAYFGEFGVRGVGYDVNDLLREIQSILATDREWTLCIIGVGNLGHAIVENDNFREMGYRFVAAFDKDQEKISKRLPCGLLIESVERLRDVVRLRNIQIGVITTPPDEAQRVTDLLVDAGIKGILNFSPTQVKAPKSCVVENVDFAVRFEHLAYHLSKVPLK